MLTGASKPTSTFQKKQWQPALKQSYWAPALGRDSCHGGGSTRPGAAGPAGRVLETAFRPGVLRPRRYMGRLVHQHEIRNRFHSQTLWRNPQKRASKGGAFFNFKGGKEGRRSERF